MTLSLATTPIVYGNWINGTGTSFTGTSQINFVGRNTQSITSAGITFPGAIYLDSNGGTLNLNDALTLASNRDLTLGGSFNTNGYNVTAANIYSQFAFARTISFGASTITASGFNAISFSVTGLTFNAGTSSIVCTAANPSVSTGSYSSGVTFYNVSFTSNSSSSSVYVAGNNTFNNLSITAPSTTARKQFSLDGNITVTGTLTAQGSSVTTRMLVRRNTPDVGVSINAAAVAINDCDFEGIAASGAASWTGTRVGDCTNNSGITFSAPKTVYWNLGGSVQWTANGWATSSGGTPAVNNFPLAQDTAIFDNTGSASTVSLVGTFAIGNIDTSARTNAMTLSVSASAVPVYGNITNGSGVTFTGTSSAYFLISGVNTQTITSAGKVFPVGFFIYKPSGSMVLADNFDNSTSGTSSSDLYLDFGTIDLNGKTLTAKTFSISTSTIAKVIAFNAGSMSLVGNGGTVWNCFSLTNLSFTGTPVVNLTYSGATGTRTIQNGNGSGGSESKSVSFNVTAGTDTVTFSSSSHIRSVDFTGFAGTLTNTSITCYGSLTFSTGMTVSNSSSPWTLASTSTGRTIRSNGKTLFPLTFNGVGGSWALQDALTFTTSGGLTLTNGDLDLAGFTATVGNFLTLTGTKSITFNGGTLAISGSGGTAFSNSVPAGLTLTNGTSTGTISMTSASAKTFAGGGFTYPCNVNQGGTGTLTVTGNNTFANFTDTVATANTIQFTGGSTSTFTAFSVSGTAGNLITLTSTNTTRATLSKATRWFMGANSTNSGNNRNLTFSAGDGIDYLSVSYIDGLPVVPGGGKFIMLF